nr:regulatory iron-sulfur-containing complex subunit RicT [Eisenibacter elegans]
MGCTTCPTGCSTTKSADGEKSSGKSCGCNKMNVFDWLSDMKMPFETEDDLLVEVRFKNGKKDFFFNKERIAITTGDAVVVEMANGFHIGFVSMQGELVNLQMKRKQVAVAPTDLPHVLRVANESDLSKFEQSQSRNLPTMYRSREIIQQLNLKMKLSDVEFQADNTKATFYYSADERVDFRELIKLLASEFRIRVEMKQISLRQEAGRLGGIGSCGRELCCSTWLVDFKNVSTAAARYQNLSLNPNKLSGQCGRLKCCLNYELETYVEALKDLPELDKPLLTKRGKAFLHKTDIFRRVLWFSYNDESVWHPISAERVGEIIALNQKGIAPESLELDEAPVLTNQSILPMPPKKGNRPKRKNQQENGKPERPPRENGSQQRPPQANKKNLRQKPKKKPNNNHPRNNGQDRSQN